MTKQAIISIGITVLLVGGVVYWLMSSPNPERSSQTGGTTSSGFFGLFRSNVGVEPTETPTEGSTVETPAAQAPDLAAQNDELLEKLSAQKVPFARVSTTAGVEGSVYALYAADVADAKASYPNSQDFSIAMAMVDLTDDGVAEALVMEDLPGHCGNAGCLLSVYTKSGASWLKIFETQAQEVALANVIVNGHRDLLVVTKDAFVGYESNVTQYTWDAGRYKYKGLVAHWDGTSFSVYGR